MDRVPALPPSKCSSAGVLPGRPAARRVLSAVGAVVHHVDRIGRPTSGPARTGPRGEAAMRGRATSARTRQLISKAWEGTRPCPLLLLHAHAVPDTSARSH